MSCLLTLIDLLLPGRRTPREIRSTSREDVEVDLNGRTYCVYAEPQAKDFGFAVWRSSIRDVTGGTCKDGGARVTPDVADAVLAKLVSYYQRRNIRYEII